MISLAFQGFQGYSREVSSSIGGVPGSLGGFSGCGAFQGCSRIFLVPGDFLKFQNDQELSKRVSSAFKSVRRADYTILTLIDDLK